MHMNYTFVNMLEQHRRVISQGKLHLFFITQTTTDELPPHRDLTSNILPSSNGTFTPNLINLETAHPVTSKQLWRNDEGSRFLEVLIILFSMNRC